MSGSITTSYTEFANLAKQPVGYNRNVWGEVLNANFQKCDDKLKLVHDTATAGINEVKVLVGTKLPLSGGTLTGALAAPSLAVDGQFSLYKAGNDPIILLGANSYLHYRREIADLAFVLGSEVPLTVRANVITANKPVILAQSPADPSHAANRAYVDAAVGAAQANANGRLSTNGGTISGNLDVGGGVFSNAFVMRADGAQDSGLYFGGDGIINLNLNGALSTQFWPSGIYNSAYGWLHEAFLSRNGSQEMSGNLRVTNAANPRVVVHSPGIAQWSMGAGGDANLWWSASDGADFAAWRMRLHQDGSLYVTGKINAPGNIETAGDVHCNRVYTTQWIHTSDRRLKADIAPLSGGLDSILALSPKSYRFSADATGQRHDGFVAQEVQEVLPASVVEMPNGMLGIDTVSLIPHLVEAIRTLNGRIEALTSEVATLKARRTRKASS